MRRSILHLKPPLRTISNKIRVGYICLFCLKSISVLIYFLPFLGSLFCFLSFVFFSISYQSVHFVLSFQIFYVVIVSFSYNFLPFLQKSMVKRNYETKRLCNIRTVDKSEIFETEYTIKYKISIRLISIFYNFLSTSL